MAELKFTRTHEWSLTAEDSIVVGITDHAQQLLGDMVFVELPEIGTHVDAGDELGVVESVKAASDFYAPISGTVIAINDKAGENPSIVNTDPYGAGWLVKIQPDDSSELAELLSESQYAQEIEKEHG